MPRRRRGDDTRVSFFSFQDIITCLAGIMIFIALLLLIDLTTSAFSGAAVSQPRPPAPVVEARVRDVRERLARLADERKRLVAESSALASIDPEDLRKLLDRLEEERRRLERTKGTVTADRASKDAEHTAAQRRVRLLKEEIRALAIAKARLDARPRKVVYTLPGEQDNSKRVLLFEMSEGSVAVQPLSGDELSPPRRLQERSASAREQWLMAQLNDFPPEKYDVLALLKPSSFSLPVDWLGAVFRKGYRVGYEPLEEDRSVIAEE